MSKTSLSFGLVLIGLGLAFYFMTGSSSYTALIPSALGLLVFGCGLLAIKSSLRRIAAYIGATIGLIGVAGGFGMAIPRFIAKDAGGAALEQFLMAVVCLSYLWFCIRSLIAARREMRKARALVGTK